MLAWIDGAGMRGRISLREFCCMRSIRIGAVWLALLTFALSGVASGFGYCCGPAKSQRPDCCAASMQMQGMDASAMERINADRGTHARQLSAASRCAQPPDSLSAEPMDRCESALDGYGLHAHSGPSALALNPSRELASDASLLLTGKTPPGSPPSALLSVLRI
jgi:hypothetical protein